MLALRAMVRAATCVCRVAEPTVVVHQAALHSQAGLHLVEPAVVLATLSYERDCRACSQELNLVR